MTAIDSTSKKRHSPAWSKGPAVRFGWAVASVFVVESLIVGTGALPSVAFFEWHFSWNVGGAWVRTLVISMAVIPSYLIFAAALMALSAWTMRLLGWRPPTHAELRIADVEWQLCDWG
jgi:hypothetical protein